MQSNRADDRTLLAFQWGEASNSGEGVGRQRAVGLKEVGGLVSGGISIFVERVE